jgi:hypothetical protein
MNRKSVMGAVIASLILATLMTPALAAPQWVEDACWRNANQVRPALNAREREAYIANSIADWTAGYPPKRSKGKGY